MLVSSQDAMVAQPQSAFSHSGVLLSTKSMHGVDYCLLCVSREILKELSSRPLPVYPELERYVGKQIPGFNGRWLALWLILGIKTLVSI